MPLNPAAVAKLWSERMQSAGPKMKDGINAVQTSPTELAAQAKDRWIAGVNKAAAEGKYEDGLREVTLSDWKAAMIDKGVANMQTGARAAVSKVERFMRDFLPYAESVSEEIKSMPKGTLADSIARSTAAITKMAAFKRSRR